MNIMPYCGHCAKEIEKVDEEPDYEYDYFGNVIDLGMVDIYNHVHSGQHLCDRGKTGAIPVNNLHEPDSKEMIAWKAMRKQVEADEAAEKKLDEQTEHEDMKEYEYLR